MGLASENTGIFGVHTSGLKTFEESKRNEKMKCLGLCEYTKN